MFSLVFFTLFTFWLFLLAVFLGPTMADNIKNNKIDALTFKNKSFTKFLICLFCVVLIGTIRVLFKMSFLSMAAAEASFFPMPQYYKLVVTHINDQWYWNFGQTRYKFEYYRKLDITLDDYRELIDFIITNKVTYEDSADLENFLIRKHVCTPHYLQFTNLFDPDYFMYDTFGQCKIYFEKKPTPWSGPFWTHEPKPHWSADPKNLKPVTWKQFLNISFSLETLYNDIIINEKKPSLVFDNKNYRRLVENLDICGRIFAFWELQCLKAEEILTFDYCVEKGITDLSSIQWDEIKWKRSEYPYTYHRFFKKEYLNLPELKYYLY